ncbi:NBR1-Ig-like domain-containing protein [Ideonella sp.]|uniref:NBR1-Ig-like domain-containing protein n=1 Tax=Ideonella sp. TaxID=1929293 RepID=UPI002B470D39|nr:NBR1-Ig-like domain-containing protein [Ideonella sp.]HJV72466.1 NBR1-Ig-like domain-containing protein [Ideonella sp.]
MLAAFLLRRCRELGLSKTELCQVAGISRETFYRLLRGDLHNVTFKTLLGLAAALHTAPLHLARLIYHELGAASLTLLPTRHDGDHASFVRDVTYPDGEVVSAGQEFVKTWEVQNTGSITWEGRSYRCEDAHLVLARRENDGSLTPVLDANLIPDRWDIPCPPTPPEAIIQVSVTFRAPPLPCTALSLWKMYDADGRLSFPQFSGLWCKVQVLRL